MACWILNRRHERASSEAGSMVSDLTVLVKVRRRQRRQPRPVAVITPGSDTAHSQY